MLPSASMFQLLPPPTSAPSLPTTSLKALSDLQGSWELQNPQGSSPYTLGPSPLRKLRSQAGHGDSKQRTGSVEERVRVGSSQMPKWGRGVRYPVVLTCLHPLWPASIALRQLLSQTPPLHWHFPPPWRKERLSSALSSRVCPAPTEPLPVKFMGVPGACKNHPHGSKLSMSPKSL